MCDVADAVRTMWSIGEKATFDFIRDDRTCAKRCWTRHACSFDWLFVLSGNIYVGCYAYAKLAYSWMEFVGGMHRANRT